MNKTDKNDPLAKFQTWFAEAEKTEPEGACAVALATATREGMPSVRMVLLKKAAPEGFYFFTNLESRKGLELSENPKAALCFYWDSTNMQVRVEGAVEAVSEVEADAYFATRDRLSQIGAWASDQSRPLEGMFELEKKVAKFTAKFGVGSVPRPPHWSGFRLIPLRIEFWKRRSFRLHERVVYDRTREDWKATNLYP